MSEGVMPWATTGQGRSFVGIGSLEAEALAAVWAREPAPVTVREIHADLRQQREIAYTTVMMVLGHLSKKGLLACDRSAKAFRYRAAIPGDQIAGQVLDSVVGRLYRNRIEAAVSHLLALDGQLTPIDLAALRQLAQTLIDD